jgi:hypothetical protein
MLSQEKGETARNTSKPMAYAKKALEERFRKNQP